MFRKFILAGVVVIFLVRHGLAKSSTFDLKSPNRIVDVILSTHGHLNYAVEFRSHFVVESSALGITVNGKDLGQDVELAGEPKTDEINETYPVLGAHDTATNHCLSTTIPLKSSGMPWQLEVRVFNDGIGFRYRIPGSGDRHVGGESSEWKIPVGSLIWSQSASNTSYESRYAVAVVGQQPKDLQIMAPATLKFENGAGYGMMTEADLINYSDMSLRTDGNAFKALFRNNPAGWNAAGEIISPWRVTILAADLNALVNSDIIKNLCPPPPAQLSHADWIRPGRAAWGWLSCYCGPKLEEQKDWIDRTRALGFEYYLIDDGWRDWNGGGDGAWNAIAELVKYAKSKNVDIWAWVNAKYVYKAENRQTYFRRVKDAGIAGLKIDFPRPADVEWVNWYEETLRDASALHLMLDLHGAVKPTGRERTWPNELTREAIAGREQGKSAPLHDITLPFCRYVQGHADFTPTLFMPERLKGSTYAHELAMAVVFTSPFLCLGDDPRHYLSSDAVEVVQALPAVWNETIVLPLSEIGEQAAFARRHENDWFIGVINDQMPRREMVSLKFLRNKRYKLVELADNPERNDAFVRNERTVTPNDSLTLPLGKDGGYVAWLKEIED